MTCMTRHRVFESLTGLLTYPSRRQHGEYMFRVPKLEQLGMSQMHLTGKGNKEKTFEEKYRTPALSRVRRREIDGQVSRHSERSAA